MSYGWPKGLQRVNCLFDQHVDHLIQRVPAMSQYRIAHFQQVGGQNGDNGLCPTCCLICQCVDHLIQSVDNCVLEQQKTEKV